MKGKVRMKSRQLTGFLMVALVVIVAVARLAGGQDSSAAQQQNEAAVNAYRLLSERTDAFCQFYMEQVKNNKPVPAASNNFKVPGAGRGMFYVYTAAEVQALIKHCSKFLELQQKLLNAAGATP
jgi:hypothetical protein